MSGPKYEEPVQASRSALDSALASGDDVASAQALVGLVFHDDDWRWCQGKRLELLDHSSLELRRIAITCLGHLARVHGRLDVAVVRPELERMRKEPSLAGAVEDADSDIRTFIH